MNIGDAADADLTRGRAATRHRIGMSKTMPALTFVRKNRLEWRDVAMPQVQGAHDALVRPIVASRCDGDCLFLFHDYSRALQLGAALHVIDPDMRGRQGDRPFAGPFASMGTSASPK